MLCVVCDLFTVLHHQAAIVMKMLCMFPIQFGFLRDSITFPPEPLERGTITAPLSANNSIITGLYIQSLTGIITYCW